MRVLKFYPHGCADAPPWVLLYRAVGADLRFINSDNGRNIFSYTFYGHVSFSILKLISKKHFLRKKSVISEIKI